MLSAREHVEAHVRGDPVEPPAKRTVSVETFEATPGAQIGFLHCVVSLMKRGEHAIAMHLEFAPERLRKPFKRPARALEDSPFARRFCCCHNESILYLRGRDPQAAPMGRLRGRCPKPRASCPSTDRH